jgi:uracil phosphoribosyltransferase
LVEEGLNQLPYSECNIITPAGCSFNGVKYIKGVCGVSIMRSGKFFFYFVINFIYKAVDF